MADFSLPWWLGPRKEPWEALVAGANAGSAIASNMLRGRQIQASMEQAAMDDQLRIKQLDATIDNNRVQNAAEQQKIDIDRDALKFKVQTRAFQTEGMMKTGVYVAETVKAGKLLDPERQAGYWELVGSLGPAVPPEMSNAIWDNTFKPAIDAKERAEEIRLRGQLGDSPASIDEFNFREVLRKKYSDEQDPTLKAERLNDLKEFEFKAGFTKNDPLKIETLEDADGTKYKVLRFGNGAGRLIPAKDESKVPAINLARYRAEVKAIEERWENYDPSFLGKDGKTQDADKYQRALNAAFERALEPVKKPAASGTNAVDPEVEKFDEWLKKQPK